MKFEIEHIHTGVLLSVDGDKYAYDSIVDVLRFLLDYIEPGSRHDAKRVYIIEAPGDKHENFTKEHSNVIWGNDEK